ncbi:C-C motif chemokine 20-like [Tautogolabrus adspersus]
MVSIKATVLVITLLTFCLLATDTSAVSKYPGCCRSYMKTKLPFRVIVGYSVQSETENCPISAIIFHTRKGKEACTNPALNWVMDYVNRLRTQAQIAHKNSQSNE